MLSHRGVTKQTRGYAMLSLLAATTIMLIGLGAAMPMIEQEQQRQREEELFWNGAQVAVALATYYRATKQYPKKLDDLLKPIIVNTQPQQGQQSLQPMQFRLRASALVDPITGEPWRVVRVGDPIIKEFAQAHDAYLAANSLNAPGRMIPLAGLPPEYLQSVLRGAVVLPSSPGNPPQLQDQQKLQEIPADTFTLNPESRGIVGVVSRSRKRAVRNYYGIESLDRCVILAAWYVAGQGGAPPGAQGGLSLGGYRLLKLPITDQLPGLPLNLIPTLGR